MRFVPPSDEEKKDQDIAATAADADDQQQQQPSPPRHDAPGAATKLEDDDAAATEETTAAAAAAADDDATDTTIRAGSSLDVTMGLAYNTYLNSNKIYGCKNCKAHLSNHEDIISRNFRGQHGKAYLFSTVVNIETGEPNERNMTTGRHVVRDISCKQCKETVGWKYDKAYEPSEKYKEGKFILEAELLCNVS